MEKPYQGPNSHLFTVRLWREEVGSGQIEWRGKVQKVSTGEAHYFRELSALISLLQTLAASESPSETHRGRREENVMKHVINREDLEPRGSTSYVFEGYRHGATSVSLHLTDLAPGEGPRLHRHPYEEVFVVYEGQATYTLGDTTLEVTAGWYAPQVHQFGRRTAATNKRPSQRAHDRGMA
jgi:quercetin dioxygenase-like cupin family protein